MNGHPRSPAPVALQPQHQGSRGPESLARLPTSHDEARGWPWSPGFILEPDPESQRWCQMLALPLLHGTW